MPQEKQERQNQHEQAIAKLREQIEGAVERKMKTPKDYGFLSDCIFKKFHEKLSPTTLKRIWGYLSESTTPRKSTLDILSKFVGYDNWDDFCEKNPTEDKPIEESPAEEQPTEGKSIAEQPNEEISIEEQPTEAKTNEQKLMEKEVKPRKKRWSPALFSSLFC